MILSKITEIGKMFAKAHFLPISAKTVKMLVNSLFDGFGRTRFARSRGAQQHA